MARIDRRRFIFHSAHGTLGLSASLAALQPSDVLAEFLETEDLPAAKQRPLRLCLLSGSFEYDSDESLDWWADYLHDNLGIVSDKVYATAVDELPSLAPLDHCDCLVLFTRRLEIEGRQLDRIKHYFEQGRPVVGIRTASHGFQTWLELDKLVFGGDYQNHYGRALKPRIEVVPEAQDHPIVEGFQPYTSQGSLYRNPGLADDTAVLLTGSIPDHTEPVAWTRVHNGARVFYTSLGHQDDFRQASFVNMITRAVHWVCQRPMPKLD